MHEAIDGTPLERAHAARARGSWQQALDVLLEADAGTPLCGSDLTLLADTAYAAGHLDVTIDVWERAHAERARAGDRLGAAGAAVRLALHLLFDTALLAPVRGWVTRAERLIEDRRDETPVHAWIAVVHAYERLLSGDFPAARVWARQAIDAGSRGDPAAAAIGRLVEARGLILEGDVRQGLGLLNDAAVATVSGELDPLLTGVVYCELICASQAVAQYDLAEQWTEAMERWRHGQPVGSLHGRCRVHRAEILRWRGCCADAEQEALRACEELRPYLRREFGWPLTELGRIRLRRGDIQGAEEAFLAAHRAGWDPQPGLALVHLARGQIAPAAASIRDALEHPVHVPSKELPPNTELRRAPLLEAQVEIAVAAGDVERARSAAVELTRVAEVFQSPALTASAAFARGRVRLADGDTRDARRELSLAARHWSDLGAPYEAALAQMALGEAHIADGHGTQARMEFEAARATFERIGAAAHAARAARACDELAEPTSALPEVEPRPQPVSAAAPTSANVFRREGEYWVLAFDGRTVRLRDGKGLRYLARLLADPGREFHVLDLVALERGEFGGGSLFRAPMTWGGTGDAGELLDGRAKAAYRRRLAEVNEDLEDARASGDRARAGQAETERDFLARELARAVGLGGRDRRAGSPAERARSAVTRAVRHTVARISRHHPVLSEHLGRALHTGNYCVYRPESRVPVTWTL
jgi:tetratricopeptide (TPR) repeat protein